MPAQGGVVGLTTALAARGAVEHRLARLFLVDDLLRELAHKATAHVFINHRARPVRMADVPVGRVVVSMTMAVAVRVTVAMVVLLVMMMIVAMARVVMGMLVFVIMRLKLGMVVMHVDFAARQSVVKILH